MREPWNNFQGKEEAFYPSAEICWTWMITSSLLSELPDKLNFHHHHDWTCAINTLQKTAWHAINKENKFVYMCHACTLSMPTFSLSDGALDTRANQMKPQLAVSFPDKINQHQFGGDCQVMMAEGGERRMKMWSTKTLWWKETSLSVCWLCECVCMYPGNSRTNKCAHFITLLNS